MTKVVLPGFLESLAPTLDHYGYLAVAGFVMLEDFGVPVPGETILIAAALYAGSGRLSIVLVAIIGFVAAITGDSIGYAIGRFGGRPLVERYGRYVWLTSERIDRATAFFERQGPKIVTVARFIEGLRQANGIVAGMTEMPWPTFLAFNALGAALWVALWTTVGGLAGSHLDAIYRAVGRYALLALALVVVAIALYGVRTLRRRRAARRAALSAASPGPGQA